MTRSSKGVGPDAKPAATRPGNGTIAEVLNMNPVSTSGYVRFEVPTPKARSMKVGHLADLLLGAVSGSADFLQLPATIRSSIEKPLTDFPIRDFQEIYRWASDRDAPFPPLLARERKVFTTHSTRRLQSLLPQFGNDLFVYLESDWSETEILTRRENHWQIAYGEPPANKRYVPLIQWRDELRERGLYPEEKAMASRNLFPDEVRDPSGALTEGSKKSVTVNAYERSPQARQDCIAHFGAVCQVCNLDFEARYGEIGQGFIHVHHIKPLNAIGDTYQVDPVKDLVPVCPNCHAMLHRKDPPLSVQELRERLTN